MLVGALTNGSGDGHRNQKQPAIQRRTQAGCTSELLHNARHHRAYDSKNAAITYAFDQFERRNLDGPRNMPGHVALFTCQSVRKEDLEKVTGEYTGDV
jgi:hypothetical protein